MGFPKVLGDISEKSTSILLAGYVEDVPSLGRAHVLHIDPLKVLVKCLDKSERVSVLFRYPFHINRGLKWVLDWFPLSLRCMAVGTTVPAPSDHLGKRCVILVIDFIDRDVIERCSIL